ncbi:PQQ-binding-like beta-propeller repeat protein [Pontibacillus yanchengensis]|uniref:PQQ-binding-like beta-propeller repeat protein n=1 Tax=Pontibacillus yanchengensis TaxID=462910 RepID=A0A6I4ZZJ6_9BACI|nr:PQQ-binding-like beta-propeller repeat protein [Pontibacillus yanchengensis]MYL33857.1 PQQ-binding-like beta-propeller repeat protein [Pontibacillus yanchengensis]
MKKLVHKARWVLLLGMLLPILQPGSAEAAFGPDEWLEYRLNDANNPVHQSEGETPLESKKFDTNDQIRSTPVVVGNRIFIGNHNTGDLYAYNIKTGEQLWTNQAPNWVHSEMIFHDGTLFVGFGNRFFQENGLRGTKESGVMALDADTGETLWTAKTEGEVMPTPAYHDGFVYAATGDRHLYKLNPESGEVNEKIEIGSTFSMSSPNISDGNLFVGGGAPKPYTFYSVDLETDEIAWKTEIPEVFAGLDDVPPAMDENIVVTTALEKKTLSFKEAYQQEGFFQMYQEMTKWLLNIESRIKKPDHMMYAMDKESGEILWESSLGIGDMVSNNKSGAPMIYDGKIFVGSPITKTFYAYDLKTGEQLWNFPNAVMKAPPVAADDVVYFTNKKGFVHALDTETGEEIGRKLLGGKLAPSGPIIMNDTLIVGSQDSNVYALPTEEIRNASDEYDEKLAAATDSKGGYVFFAYVLPLVVLGIVVAAVIAVVRRRNKH